MRKQIIAITVLTAFAEAAAAGAFDEPQAPGGVRLTWTVSFGGTPAAAPASPQTLAWAQTGQSTGTPTPLPPPPTSEPATSGEITTLPMEPPPPPPEKKGYFSRITGVQWLGIGLAVLALGAVAADSGGGDEEPAPVGSGGGG